jgi:hypothetical protein
MLVLMVPKVVDAIIIISTGSSLAQGNLPQ